MRTTDTFQNRKREIKMKVSFKKDSKKYYEFEFSGSSRKAFLVDRSDNPDEIKDAAVYILMDKRKRCFYIGQTGDTDCAGFANRSAVHKWEKKWWEQALVFTDEHGDFQEKLRKWLEGRLNEIAKTANTSLILSIGKKDPSVGDVDSEEILAWVLQVCQLVGLPWAYPMKNAEQSECTVKIQKAKKTKSALLWNKPYALAKEIANKYNCGKGAGGICQLLTRRKSVKTGKWRDAFVVLGLKFDENDMVVDWRTAKNPLPDQV